MKNLFMTCVACLTLLVAMSMSASAQLAPSPWDSPTQTQEARSQLPACNLTTSNQLPACLSASDPDRTGYPFINNWKGNLVRDPNVFLTNDERQNMTQARVDLTVGLAPVFLLHENAIRSMLTPQQDFIFESIVATQDMETLSVMNDVDCKGYVANLSQQLHLDGGQEAQLRSIVRHLMVAISPVQAQYAARFDQEIATAEQRVVAERTARNINISTSTVETENK